MANSKRKCKHCKEFIPVENGLKINAGFFCDYNHATLFAMSKSKTDKAKAVKQKNAKQKREFKQSDIKTRKPAAVKACHAYIRARDKHLPCICCGKPLGDDYHAGHWLNSGNNPLTRFDEDNIHGQRLDCNFFKGGDSGDYEKNLRLKIGDERVDLLLSKKGCTEKRTAQDYLAIEKYYKEKLKLIIKL